MLLFFDKRFGKKNYTIMVTSDHGAATSPDVLKKLKFNGGRFDSRKLLLELNRHLFDVFGQDQLVSKAINMQFYLNFDIINSAGIELDLLVQKMKQFLEAKEYIKFVYDMRSKVTIGNSSRDLVSTRQWMLPIGLSQKELNHGQAFSQIWKWLWHSILMISPVVKMLFRTLLCMEE